MAITILAAVVMTSTSFAYAASFNEEACPDCGGEDVYTKANLGAQNVVPILVWTDSSIYDHESTIMVEGTVASIRSNTDVGIVVIGPPPFNNIVSIDQVSVGSDGKFSTTLSTSGEPWKYDGTYTIKVTYGTQEVFDKTEVQLTGGIIGRPSVACGSDELAASDQCIPYSISGATVTSAWLNTQDNSLIVNISTSDEGTITLNPSGDVISGIFMVLVDGEQWDDVVIDGNTVTVMFPDGAEEIEIIGTFVIPEFGTIAALILAVAIISIIVVSTRTRLSVLPKF